MFLIFLLGLLIGLLITWYFLEGRYRLRVEEVQKSWEGKVKHLETEVKQADVAHEETKTLLRRIEGEHKGCGARLSEYEARLRDAHAALERSAEAEASMRKSLETLRNAAGGDDKALAEAHGRILELEARLRAAEQARTTGSSSARASSSGAEQPLGFAGGWTSQTVPPAAVSAPDDRTRRLKALDAKIRQLPAGSSARRKLENERASLATAGATARSSSGASGGAGDEALPQLFTSAVGEADDLKIIKGIGPVLEKKLNKLGITRFAQVAALTTADIEKIDEVLDFKGRIEREGWVEQARELSGS